MAMPKAAVVARIEVRMSYPPIVPLRTQRARQRSFPERVLKEEGAGTAILLCRERKFAAPFGCPSEVPTQPLRLLLRELRQSFPVEADSVAGPGWRQCHALVEDQRVFDIPIEPESVRLE